MARISHRGTLVGVYPTIPWVLLPRWFCLCQEHARNLHTGSVFQLIDGITSFKVSDLLRMGPWILKWWSQVGFLPFSIHGRLSNHLQSASMRRDLSHHLWIGVMLHPQPCNPSDRSTPSCSHFLWKPGTMALRRFLNMFQQDSMRIISLFVGRVTVLGHNGTLVYDSDIFGGPL